MKTIYLILAILGAVTPYAFVAQYVAAEGLSVSGFVAAVFANGAATAFSADLFISSFVFWLFMFARRREQGGPSPYGFIGLNLVFGLSCALPAFLYAAEKMRDSAGAARG